MQPENIGRFIAVMSIAIVWLIFSLRRIFKYRKSKRKECNGEIVEIKIESSNALNNVHIYLTKYEYIVDGILYTGYHRTSKKYDLGMFYKVYYRADDPKDSTTKNHYKRSIQSVITLFLTIIVLYIFAEILMMV